MSTDQRHRQTGRRRRGARRTALAALALTVLWPALWPAVWPGAAAAAVFGIDDRMPLPDTLKPLQQSIGVMFNVRARTLCSAFCVASHVVATAGHCLFRTHGETPARLKDFWFARNYDAVKDYSPIAGYQNGSVAQNVLAGATDLSVRPPIAATRDWVLVRLARPVCAKRALPVTTLSPAETEREAKAGHVFQISYHRDFTQWRPAYSRPCEVKRDFAGADWPTIARDFAEPELLLLHTCDTGGASSGSPLLLATPSGPKVIGINVGTYVQSKVEVENGRVTQRYKADTIANTGVNAAAFARLIGAFQEAAILTSGPPLRALQERLAQRGLYAGRIDGAYGPGVREAIRAYETAEHLPVTGLATEALLARLDMRKATRASTH